MNTKNLKVGEILSETSFYTIKNIKDNAVELIDDLGNSLTISKKYIEKIINSADFFEATEEKTMTELAELFINSPRIAMTVAFFKKDQAKTKKAYEAEKKAKIEEIQSARVADVPKLLNDLIENPLSKVIPGELRIMKGRHYGSIDELGRIQFIDMEQSRDASKDYDTRLRQVDPRTIQYIIVGGVKYQLKK